MVLALVMLLQSWHTRAAAAVRMTTMASQKNLRRDLEYRHCIAGTIGRSRDQRLKRSHSCYKA
jgi:hypothetical protein